MSVMQKLHDSEINSGKQSFVFGCWSAWIGDPMNGERARNDSLSSNIECHKWLDETARKLYPDSVYAQTPPEEITK